MLAAQCAVARTILGISVEQLAEKAGVSADVVLRIEPTDNPTFPLNDGQSHDDP